MTAMSAPVGAIAYSSNIQWSLSAFMVRISSGFGRELCHLLRPAITTEVPNGPWVDYDRLPAVGELGVDMEVVLEEHL